jgi:hypothetical protein
MRVGRGIFVVSFDIPPCCKSKEAAPIANETATRPRSRSPGVEECRRVRFRYGFGATEKFSINRNARFTPESGHSESRLECPLSHKRTLRRVDIGQPRSLRETGLNQ